MNIIFEGIDGTGKTTLIKKIIKKLNEEDYQTCYIKEIAKSPLRPLLKKMLEGDPFFNNHQNFKTSIFETFLLAAEFFYKQEHFRDISENINFYDRDFLTILCYQKFMMEREYGAEIEEFYKHFTKCLLFDLKQINLVVYVSCRNKLSFKRVEMRDKIILTEGQKCFLKKAKEYFEKVLLVMLHDNNIPVLYIDGEINSNNSVKRIVDKIKYAEIKNKIR